MISQTNTEKKTYLATLRIIYKYIYQALYEQSAHYFTLFYSKHPVLIHFSLCHKSNPWGSICKLRHLLP